MKNSLKVLTGLFIILGLWSCTSPNDIVDYTDDLAVIDPEPGSTPGYNEDKNVYFGDLHVHTKHSFDAVSYTHLTLPTKA